MLSHRKVGGLSQRRFVVEIARPVAPADVERAAVYIARRLSMDEGRIHTLLSDRTGPVTRDVLADKADAIAKVFKEAGVMVTIVEKPVAEAAGGEPETDYEYQGPAGTTRLERWADVEDEPADASEGVSEESLEGEADGAYAHEAEAEARASQEARGAPTKPGGLPDDLTHRDFPHAVDLRLSSTRWVPSPHGDAYGDTYDDTYGDELSMAEGEFDDEPPGEYDVGFPAQPPEKALPPFDGGVIDDLEGDSADFARDFDDHAEVDDRYQSGLWLAPDSSPFGELGAAPNERPRLRAYLLWALVLSLVVLVVLQLVLAARDSAAGGSTYEEGLAPYRAGEFAVARKVWEGAASHGDPRAQYMLGYLVQNGLGQPWSNRSAARWYELAAAQGHPEAQTALANLYLEGLGVPPDAQAGLELLRQAADAGHPPALYQYAALLFHGRWVKQDYAAALETFQAAAQGGSAEAADFVGLAQYLQDEAERQAAQRQAGDLAAD